MPSQPAANLRAPDGVLLLATQTERGAARDQHSEWWNRLQDIRDERRGVQDVLEIVDHQ